MFAYSTKNLISEFDIEKNSKEKITGNKKNSVAIKTAELVIKFKRPIKNFY